MFNMKIIDIHAQYNVAMHNKILLYAMKVLAQFIEASSAPLSPCELTLHSLSATTLCTSNSSHLQTQTGRERVEQR